MHSIIPVSVATGWQDHNACSADGNFPSHFSRQTFISSNFGGNVSLLVLLTRFCVHGLLKLMSTTLQCTEATTMVYDHRHCV